MPSKCNSQRIQGPKHVHYSSTLTVFVQFLFHFVFVFGVEQVKNKSDRCLPRHALLRKRVLVGGYLATCVKRPRWEKKRKDKRTFFQVCFSFSTPPEAQSFYELSGLFLKSVGLSALQKQHRVPKKLEGRVVFFLSSFSFSFLFNYENYSKSSPLLCPLPLHPLVPPQPPVLVIPCRQTRL